MTEITTIADLKAQPVGAVVLDGQAGAWQCTQLDRWFGTGCELERSPAEMLEIGPLRLIHSPEFSPAHVLIEGGRVHFASVEDYFNHAIAYVLRTAAKSRLPDSWRTLTAEQFTHALSTHLLAGLHPVLFDHSVASGIKVARAEMARAAAARASIKPGGTVQTPDGIGFVYAFAADEVPSAHVTLDGQDRKATFPLDDLNPIGT